MNSFVRYGDIVSSVNTSDGDWHSVQLYVSSQQNEIILTVDGVETKSAYIPDADFTDLNTVSAIVIADNYEGMYRAVCSCLNKNDTDSKFKMEKLCLLQDQDFTITLHAYVKV